MITSAPGRPQPSEYAPYYDTYISKVEGDDPVYALEAQTARTQRVFEAIPAAKADHRYAAGKWTVRDVIGHIADAERVFAFRALWFARADANPLPGFDENAWVPAAQLERVSLADVITAWRTQREATIAMLKTFAPDTWQRTGTANGKVISVRALAYTMVGHEVHHLGVLAERYGITA